jgi:SAM-dependent MidA family methyltransferase
VQRQIETHGGWLPFDEYVRIVLYAPGLGYYSAGSAKLGREGDFVTAPELSELFGRALGRQCAEVLQGIGAGSAVLELGAGSGALAAALLPVLQELHCLPEHYDILEVSADLIARQRERLAQLPPELFNRIRWLAQLPGEPVSGVMLANEVADALPFRRFLVGGDGPLERGVASLDGALTLSDRSADEGLRAELQRIAASVVREPRERSDSTEHPNGTSTNALPWAVGYESELCLMLDSWVASLSASLARGALVILDYGLPRHEYYHPERVRGTLRCHFRHRAHEDALRYPGLQDITAWVDFTRVAEAAVDADLQVAGYCTQAAFLLANGIEADVAREADSVQRARRAAQARQLLLPGEMGEHFKVMALTRGWGAPLRGFRLQDLRRSL